MLRSCFEIEEEDDMSDVIRGRLLSIKMCWGLVFEIEEEDDMADVIRARLLSI